MKRVYEQKIPAARRCPAARFRARLSTGPQQKSPSRNARKRLEVRDSLFLRSTNHARLARKLLRTPMLRRSPNEFWTIRNLPSGGQRGWPLSANLSADSCRPCKTLNIGNVPPSNAAWQALFSTFRLPGADQI